MNKRKILLVSINSSNELTGGGHYLRSLIHGYAAGDNNLTVIGKQDKSEIFNKPGVHYISYKKTLLSDLISRLFLSPSFLLFYFFKIIGNIKQADIIAIHSSRLGWIIAVTRALFPNKIIISHFDNNESHLLFSRLKVPVFDARYFLTCVDCILIHLSEWLFLKMSNKRTFITKNDAQSFNYSSKYIIPICFESTTLHVKRCDGNKVLFTASFDFEPNILALKEFIEIAKYNPSFEFIAAGRKISKLNYSAPPNVRFISDPSNDEMHSLFLNTNYYISCVSTGSGMKTKVAEAMKYQIPIIATKHSLIGYEDVRGKNYIFEYKSVKDISSSTFDILSGANSSMDIMNDYLSYYSYTRVETVIDSLLRDLKK